MYVKQHSSYRPLTPEQTQRFLDLTQAEVDEALSWARENLPPAYEPYFDALPLESVDELPDSPAELEAAMDAGGVDAPRRSRLRKQYSDGVILFVVGGVYINAAKILVHFPRALLERAVRAARDEMRDDVAELRDAEISLGEWEQRSMRKMRVLYLVAAGLAGGLVSRNATIAFRGLAQQYGYLAVMANDIATGHQRTGGMFRRIRRYAGFARAIFQSAVSAALGQDEWPEERNILGHAEHCSECVELAEMGWVPRGTLPPIGSRICGNECKCSIERRNRSGLIVRA